MGTVTIPSPVWVLYTLSSNPFGRFYPQPWVLSSPTHVDQYYAEYLRGDFCWFPEFSLCPALSFPAPYAVNSTCFGLPRFSSLSLWLKYPILRMYNHLLNEFPIVRCLGWFYCYSHINYNHDYPHAYILTDSCKYSHIIGPFLAGKLLAEWLYACLIMKDNAKLSSRRLHQLALYVKYIKMTFGSYPCQ